MLCWRMCMKELHLCVCSWLCVCGLACMCACHFVSIHLLLQLELKTVWVLSGHHGNGCEPAGGMRKVWGCIAAWFLLVHQHGSTLTHTHTHKHTNRHTHTHTHTHAHTNRHTHTEDIAASFYPSLFDCSFISSCIISWCVCVFWLHFGYTIHGWWCYCRYIAVMHRSISPYGCFTLCLNLSQVDMSEKLVLHC